MKGNPRPHDAPRLRAYLARIESRRILRMRRADWLRTRPARPEPALICIDDTPMSKVAAESYFIAATAEALGSSSVGIKVYRRDPHDPKPFNVDAYDVWENLPSRMDFDEIVQAASTNCDANMLSFLEEMVFIVAKDAGSSHWLDEAELPVRVRMLIAPADPNPEQSGSS